MILIPESVAKREAQEWREKAAAKLEESRKERIRKLTSELSENQNRICDHEAFEAVYSLAS